MIRVDGDLGRLIGRFVSAYEKKARAEWRDSIIKEATLTYQMYGLSAAGRVLKKVEDT